MDIEYKPADDNIKTNIFPMFLNLIIKKIVYI